MENDKSEHQMENSFPLHEDNPVDEEEIEDEQEAATLNQLHMEGQNNSSTPSKKRKRTPRPRNNYAEGSTINKDPDMFLSGVTKEELGKDQWGTLINDTKAWIASSFAIAKQKELEAGLSKDWVFLYYITSFGEIHVKKSKFTTLVFQSLYTDRELSSTSSTIASEHDKRLVPATTKATQEMFPFLDVTIAAVTQGYSFGRVPIFIHLKLNGDPKSMDELFDNHDSEKSKELLHRCARLFGNKIGPSGSLENNLISIMSSTTSSMSTSPSSPTSSPKKSRERKRRKSEGSKQLFQLTAEQKKGLDIRKSSDGSSFVLVFDTPGLKPDQIGISFPTESSIQLVRKNGSCVEENELQDRDFYHQGRKKTRMYISFQPKLLNLPFPVKQADPTYAEQFIFYHYGTILIKLSPKNSNELPPPPPGDKYLTEKVEEFNL